MTIDETQLRTGASVPAPLLATTTIALQELLNAGYAIAAYELVELARDPGHELFGNIADVLARFGLLSKGGYLHSAVRDIVLASFDGTDFDLTLVNPVAIQEA